MHKEFLKLNKQNNSKTPEKSIHLENNPSSVNLSMQKIDGFQGNSKELLQETIIQLAIEEEVNPKNRHMIGKTSIDIEEDFL